MFVALRDLRFARGRFILIGSVVALITLLVGFLSGLTGGLAIQNISAVLALPGDRIVFSAPEGGDGAVSFADSAITAQQAADWAATSDVTDARPLGISQTRAETDDMRAAIALFGVEPGFDSSAPSGDGRLSLSQPAADALGVATGEKVEISGVSYVVETIEGDDWYSHTPVVQMTLQDWRTYSAATGNPDAYATVLAVSGSPDWDAADTANDTISETTIGSLTALSAFRSEIGSLLLMVVLLFGISGLVIGAFFTVWTMQRKGDVAVLKALGASTGSLVRDALGQALIVLLVGIGVGLGLVTVLGLLAGTALPFLLSPVTTFLPGVIMIALGLAGAAFALRSVTSADPLTALGSNR
ncbi:FtsX-like permease family protein [Microbacterium hydrocarbonoxydans]|uniref:Putative ABC transport system permease protein n=1 Tax=Microbacterium hydrocarbonoxydans TaxID=273678 RepID=A0A1H4IU59_9MICO|nr:ABC transporter permease [Microbacterium hydrocarbonoxydans]SEB37599.1 putative ABC transport system permease protein [Microbacterium hydrocarbonoxydans]